MLRRTGFLVVTLYDEYGDAESKIADPVMICGCGLKGQTLLTGDKDLVSIWTKEIIEAGIAVFVTTDNNEGPIQWGPRIINAKQDIVRELKRRKKPFTARISTDGRVTQVRVFDGTRWTAIAIGRKNPPHVNKYKPQTESESS